MLNRAGFNISHERARIVRQEVAENSEPGIRFYVMVVVSTMIAGFGLITNSTAVIIGAMLVAPLMTPIFGMALALINSDAYLLGRAARAEIAGVFSAILMGFVLGVLHPNIDPTPEMLSRTQPQLFDLLVAVLSGFAGAYALVDEKISPALPGVAIATAIVPPLANTGLCFAVGAYKGGIGSFLLFFSNFLSILLVGSIVFGIFGMTGRYHDLDQKAILRRFTLPVVGFLVIAVVLTHTLIQISEDRRIKKIIENILIAELADLPSAIFDKMDYMAGEDKIYVFAHAHSSSVLSPKQVGKIQKRLEEELKQPSELTIQSNMSYTVAAVDSFNQVSKRNLDGHFIKKSPHPLSIKTKIADSTIRHYLADKPTFSLFNVRLIQRDDSIIVLATIEGIIIPDEETIEKMERILRSKLEDQDLRLVVQLLKPDLYDREGRLHFELTGFVDLNSEQELVVNQTKKILQKRFQSDVDFSLAGFDYTLIDDVFNYFLEINGNQVFPIVEVKKLERLVIEHTSHSVKLHAISNIETVTTSTGYESYRTLSQRILKELQPKLKKDLEEIITNSNL